MKRKTAVTKDGFKKLNRNVIFIACPNDLKPIRVEVESMIRSVMNDTASNLDIKPYSWDIDIELTSLDQKKSWQKNIPRSSDRYCLGVITMIGEKLGAPLEEGFKVEQYLKNYDSWAKPDHKYKLQHPWNPANKEKEKAWVAEGKYPLTGTVFEFLDAFTSNKTKLNFTLLANKSLHPGNRSDIRLNRNTHQKDIIEKITTQPKDLVDEAKEYVLETEKVKNFLCALSKRNIPQNPCDNSEIAIIKIKKWIIEDILKGTSSDLNPYKFLHYYDVNDSYNFFGRESLTSSLIQKLQELFKNKTESNIIGLTGSSGSGKSSMLRAGILAKLHEPYLRNEFYTVAFRPTDFETNEDSMVPKSLPRQIFEFIETQTGISFPKNNLNKFHTYTGPNWGSKAIKFIEETLKNNTDLTSSKLIIGIDQFEEILDFISNDNLYASWFPLIDFIEAAGKSTSCFIVYTLENTRIVSRDRLINEEKIPPSFDNHFTKEIGFTNELLTEIIDRPFKRAGYYIESKVLNAIQNDVAKLKDKITYNSVNSLLPLVSLMLSKLFDYVKEHQEPKHDFLEENTEMFFDENAKIDSDNNSHIIRLENVYKIIELEKVIKEEAEVAWSKAKGNNSPEIKHLDWFLQPLIGLGGTNFEQIQLLKIQNQRPYTAEQELTKEFKNHRLIVPVQEGKGSRLIHEAVIRFWPDAYNWFENRKDYLREEQSYRRKAQEWNINDRPTDINISENEIDFATEILGAYFRDWSYLGKLSSDDEILRSYCLNIFSKSNTPLKQALHMGKPITAHINVAASYGMLDLMKKFKSKNPKAFIFQSETGRTPLIQAVWCNHLNIVEYLINQKISIKSNKLYKDPVILISIQTGNIEIFQLLLDSTSKKDCQMEDGSNLLHFCAIFNRVEMAKELILKKGLDPNKVDDLGFTPLLYCSRQGNLGAFSFFKNISDDKTRTKDKSTLLHLASLNGHESLVKEIISDPIFRRIIYAKDNNGKTALHLAAQNLHYNTVQTLMNSGFNINEGTDKNKTPLHLLLDRSVSLSEEQERLIKILDIFLDHKLIDLNTINDEGETPLGVAARLGNLQVLQKLLKHKKLDASKSINIKGETPIIISFQISDWKSFRAFKNKSSLFDESSIDNKGNNTYHLIAIKSVPEDIKNQLLAQQKGNINRLNQEGKTPLIRAIEYEKWDIAQDILTYGGDPMIFGKSQKPPLFTAFELDAPIDFIEILYNINKNQLNAVDYFGWTLLHRALVYQQPKWIEWLKSKHAYIDQLKIKDRMGWVPLEITLPSFLEKIEDQHESTLKLNTTSWDSNLEWKKLGKREKETFIRKIQSKDERIVIDESVDIFKSPLNFYDKKDVQIFYLQSTNWNNSELKIYFLKSKKELHRLDGTSPPIHTINSQYPLNINSKSVLDYLRFFCYFVRGEEGAFYVTEGINVLGIPQSIEVSAKEKEALTHLPRPAMLTEINLAKNYYLVFAVIYYSNAIFFADFKIYGTGMVEMLDDFPVIDNLSVIIDEPIDFN